MKGDQPGQPLISGLAALHALHQKNVADGKKIFDLVTQEAADANSLKGIVYQESLLQLIFYVLDHRKEVTSRVNQDKSAKQRTVAATAAQAQVIDWCNVNPESARLPYKNSVDLAMKDTKISASTSVRNYISEWRKSNPKT
jgi:hypothetical protein